MYKVTPSLVIYNASDQSGVLVFVPQLGQTTCLEPEVGHFLINFDNTSFSKESFCSAMLELCCDEGDKLWKSLISARIIVKDF
jgi:hypothetical protein